MDSPYTIGFLSLCLVLMMSACDSKGPCERHYSKAGEVRACVMGSDDIAVHALKSYDAREYPEADEARKICSRECHSRFDVTKSEALESGDEKSYAEEVIRMADMTRACSSACQVRMSYEKKKAEENLDGSSMLNQGAGYM